MYFLLAHIHDNNINLVDSEYFAYGRAVFTNKFMWEVTSSATAVKFKKFASYYPPTCCNDVFQPFCKIQPPTT